MRPALVLAAGLLLATLGLAGCAFGPPLEASPNPAAGRVSAPPLIGPQALPSAAAANPVRQPDGSFLFVPSSARVVPGVVYRYTLFTHCGVTPTGFDFDGSYWDPVAEVTPKLADPEDVGTIQLVSPDEAVYTTAGGGVIGLRRAPTGNREGFPCD